MPQSAQLRHVMLYDVRSCQLLVEIVDGGTHLKHPDLIGE